ncbi:MAG TPA: dihydroorotate dehydrogenase-like protein [Opitutaceae bacterium]|nr:dihydroorotate dehydrogenase-like protein [Opitutaceae bacterium]
MDLSTSYLGLKLVSPLVVGASPLADDIHTARQIQDAGAGAVVMRSLFEEQIYLEELSHAPRPSFLSTVGDPERSVFPALAEYQLNPEQYIRQIADLKAALTIPVIASLNGCRPGGWIDYASRFQNAGADAIELNLYQLSTDPGTSALDVEAEMLEAVQMVRGSVRIPVAVKLQPFFTSLPHFAQKLGRARVDGIVLFNRFYQADIDVSEQLAETRLRLSDPAELLLRLRWLAILTPQLRCSFALSGGVHDGGDALKAILAGAHAVQLVSVLLRHGPRFLATLIESMRKWMGERGYESVSDFRGSMSLDRCLDAASHERGSYQRILQNWRV